MNLSSEEIVRRALVDRGYEVHNANIIFQRNCPNIDLVVYGKNSASYVQVKSSSKPAQRDHVTIDGSPWTQKQLDGQETIFNRKEGFKAEFVVLVFRPDDGALEFYIAPAATLNELVLPVARALADKPKRDGTRRSIAFRKELSKKALREWLDAWNQFGEPVRDT